MTRARSRWNFLMLAVQWLVFVPTFFVLLGAVGWLHQVTQPGSEAPFGIPNTPWVLVLILSTLVVAALFAMIIGNAAARLLPPARAAIEIEQPPWQSYAAAQRQLAIALGCSLPAFAVVGGIFACFV